MTEKPGWLSDAPVDVDVDSLATFASVVQAELDHNVAPGTSSILTRLTGGPEAQAQRTFGVDSRYHQGVLIGNYHSECETRARQLLNDFQLGMAAIAAAAHSIAADYRSADSLNSMDVKKIGGYFNPKDRSKSLAEQLGIDPTTVDPAGGPQPTGGGSRPA
jgi:hypothetical protein